MAESLLPFIQLYDTTLRDGMQRADLSLSCDDKIRIAQRLDGIGVGFIEGGWPFSNPKDVEFFFRAKDMAWQSAKIAAFGSTRRVGLHVEDDANLRALLDAQTPVCTLVGKSWMLHVTEVLRTTADENLRLIEESITYLREHQRRVIFDAEHFFEGYAADISYSLEIVKAAGRAGAEVVVLCDTNGGCLPWEVESIVRSVADVVAQGSGPQPALGIHAHNDIECAVASSIAAVRAGATHVQGTINGYGERCGNANLCSIIPTIELKLGLPCLPAGGLAQLYDLSHFVAEVANVAPDEQMAYVGRNAFAHKGGIHVAAMRRNQESYQHVAPHLVGNQMRVLVSELSGRGTLLSKAEELGIEFHGEDAVCAVMEEVKVNEAQGFSYEAAEASVALMLVRRQEGYEPPYRLVDYRLTVGHTNNGRPSSQVSLTIDVNGSTVSAEAQGEGPVGALDRALRKALIPAYPELAEIYLADYKVRILDSYKATAAKTRVLIDTTDGRCQWGTVGASPNIIEASCRALCDAIEFGLLLRARDKNVTTQQWAYESLNRHASG